MSSPESQKLAEVSAEVSVVVARAREIEVSTPEQAQDATGFLAELKATKDRSEEARKFLVEPLNAHVKAINARMKGAVAPLARADEIVREKVLYYQREQERLRAEEQARLDAERQAAEEQAAAVRRAAWEEAQRAEREAAEAERRRQEQSGKRRRELAVMSDDELMGVLTAHENDPRQHAVAEVARVRAEFKSRTHAIEAQQRAAEAMRAAEEATQVSIAAQAAPAPKAAAVSKLAADSGSAAVRQRWIAQVEDADSVPREYMMPDLHKINAAVREGVHTIPGVRIEQVSGLAVRAR